MQQHHQIEFAQFMESIFLNGSASVRWDRVHMWFKAEEMTTAIWQQIHAKWVDVCTSHGYGDDVSPLFSYSNASALIIVREGFSDEEVLEITADGAEEVEETEE